MVGLMVRRSPEMLVGLLGILKAGGAYVPLDPDYPAARLEFMLEDTAPPVLLITEDLRERVPKKAPRVLALDTDWSAIAVQPRENPEVAVTARHLAYVMYTSGSTGRPKGTCIEQRGVVRLVANADYMALGQDTVFTQYSPISFDAATLEIWGSLLNGGRLVLCPPGVLSMEELGRVIRTHGVNTAWLTTALFQQMVNEQLDSLRGVRQLLTGGDVASAAHVRRVLDEIDGITLVNAYGPTENTTFTTCHTLVRGEDLRGGVPIGRPIGSTSVYLLDEAMRPVPVGVAGELYTGGDGLAREYLHQPELTSARFVPDPFSGKPGARLYRTGDLARYREDGVIEFVGRIDHQVKLRGFRIELGEIDTALGQYPAVRESVTLAREDVPGDKRLVAYVACGRDEVSPDELRAHLRTTLPDYMVPAAFVLLDALPVTPNGKVDRAALPAPEGGRQVGIAFVAPTGELEGRIATIWQEVLRLERVGVDDNFFDLGGNSMLLVRAHGKLKPTVGEGLKVVDLFRFPTIRALAQHLSQDAGGGGSGRFDEIRERARRRREAGRRASATR
jgi:amino acid adenylation domain-containing protein